MNHNKGILALTQQNTAVKQLSFLSGKRYLSTNLSVSLHVGASRLNAAIWDRREYFLFFTVYTHELTLSIGKNENQPQRRRDSDPQNVKKFSRSLLQPQGQPEPKILD